MCAQAAVSTGSRHNSGTGIVNGEDEGEGPGSITGEKRVRRPGTLSLPSMKAIGIDWDVSTMCWNVCSECLQGVFASPSTLLM
jgi:hypothetical protein